MSKVALDRIADALERLVELHECTCGIVVAGPKVVGRAVDPNCIVHRDIKPANLPPPIKPPPLPHDWGDR